MQKLIKLKLWDEMTTLDDLWVRGIVDSDSPSDVYILYNKIYELDDDTLRILGLPTIRLQVMIKVLGNLISSQFNVYWQPSVNGRTWGHWQRYGPFVQLGEEQFLLSSSQLRLIEVLEKALITDEQLTRARFLDRIKKLSDSPNILIDSFVSDEEFNFPEKVGFDVIAGDNTMLQIKPTLLGIDQTIQNVLPDVIGDRIAVNSGNKRTYIYPDKGTQSIYKSVPRMITDSDVPAFIDNPLAYLPDNVEFDEDAFSKRVKGLKVLRSSVMPYIHIEKTDDNGDWFDFAVGATISSDNSAEESVAHNITTAEFEMLVDNAIQNNTPYVLVNGEWIKVDADVGMQFIQKLSKLKELDSREKQHIDRKKLRVVLDIFDNLAGVEYSEEFAREKEKSESDAIYPLPKSLNAILRPYQYQGYTFICANKTSNMGALIADDMGLGKTVQVIAYLAHLLETSQLFPALIVLPAALIDNWIVEFTKFLPSLSLSSIYVHQGSQRTKDSMVIASYGVVLTTYETLARDQVMLGKVHWSVIICDEAQKIKNFKTQAACAAKGMKADMKMALTGTPVENRLAELWSIVDFVQPGLLKSYSWFAKEYERPIQRDDENAEALSNALVKHINPIFLRRTKEAAIGNELPPLTEHQVYVPLSNKQSCIYSQIIDDYSANPKMALACIQKLLSVCGHPALVSDPILDSRILVTEAPKLKATLDLLEGIRDKREKAIVFTKMHRMQSILRLVIYKEFGINAMTINGSVHESRVDIINSFSAVPGFNVIILSPRAAGVGLNIIGANHVIHYTREWNPAVENQATDRVYRIGQTRPVEVYYPICTSDAFITAEVRLNELLNKKKELMKKVIIPSNLDISVEEMADVLAK